jgi:RNA polymerase sigma-70 factor (ECF subfamily)
MRVVPTRANTQPAFGVYRPDPETGIGRPYSLFVLALEGDRISAITRFGDTGVMALFGLPRTIPW